jgi:hypothetical protein
MTRNRLANHKEHKKSCCGMGLNNQASQPARMNALQCVTHEHAQHITLPPTASSSTVQHAGAYYLILIPVALVSQW